MPKFITRTKKELVQEIIHCGREPIYFINTYAKIQHPVKGLVPFQTFNYQNDAVQAFLKHRLNIILKARQLGFTTVVAAFIAWFIIFNKDKNVLIVSTKAETAKNTIRIIRNILKYLPKELMLCRISVDNRQSIELTNGSRVKAITTSADAGRSEAVSLLFIDEAAHVEKMDELWTGIWPTISCLHYDTLCLTSNGFKKIGSLIPSDKKAGDYFELTGPLSLWGKNGLESVSHGYVSPASKTFKITTKYGREIEVTEKHPLYTLAKFGGTMKQARDLKIGDYLRVDLGMNIWGKTNATSLNEPITENLAYCLGGYIAEAWIDKKETIIEVANQDDEFREQFIANSFGKPFRAKNNDKVRMRCCSMPMIALFKRCGIEPSRKCQDKVVPSIIWSCPKNIVAAFLRGYYDGDGSATSRGIIACSTSKQLLLEIQLLLQNFGIVSNLSKTNHEKYIGNRIMPGGRILQSLKPAYILVINKHYSHIFKNQIGFAIKRKQNNIKTSSMIQDWSNDVPLEPIRKTLLDIVSQRSGQWFRNTARLRTDRLAKGVHVNRTYLRKLQNIIVDYNLTISDEQKKIFEDLDENCFWDKIVKVEESFADVTYDFTVPGTHTFLQNGILGSNTGGRAILSSTPNGTANFFYRTFKQAQNYENNFNCRYGTYHNPMHSQESFNDRFMWYVMPGHDAQWFADETAGKNERDIAQEYRCEFNASGDTFLPGNILHLVESCVTEPIDRSWDDRNLWIWQMPENNGVYIISCDVSSGFSTDYSAFHVLRIDSSVEQVAEYKGKIPADMLGELLMKVSIKYNNATIAPENNSGWSAQAIQKITEANYPFLYWSPRTKGQFVDIYNESQNQEALPGYRVTSANRMAMLAKLEQYVRKGDLQLKSQRLLDELREFIWVNNRPQAARSAHDDLIMALAGGLWIREESFMSSYKNADATKALINSMSKQTTPVSQLDNFNMSSNDPYSNNKVNVTLSNGMQVDITKFLLSMG